MTDTDDLRAEERTSRFDLTAWTPTTCAEADALHDRLSLRVAAAFTDIAGDHGDLLSYREWSHLDSPVLREFRYRPPLGCAHYVPAEETR